MKHKGERKRRKDSQDLIELRMQKINNTRKAGILNDNDTTRIILSSTGTPMCWARCACSAVEGTTTSSVHTALFHIWHQLNLPRKRVRTPFKYILLLTLIDYFFMEVGLLIAHLLRHSTILFCQLLVLFF